MKLILLYVAEVKKNKYFEMSCNNHISWNGMKLTSQMEYRRKYEGKMHEIFHFQNINGYEFDTAVAQVVSRHVESFSLFHTSSYYFLFMPESPGQYAVFPPKTNGER